MKDKSLDLNAKNAACDSKSNYLYLMDIVSVIFILFYHSATFIMERKTFTDALLCALCPFLVTFGMTAFTFSSGYKLIFNHFYEINDKEFILSYMKKRFNRLYMPYLLYSILMAIILYLLNVIADNLDIKFPFWTGVNLNPVIVAEFVFLGLSPTAGHLWYLYVLLMITLIILACSYLFDIRIILYGIFPMLLLYSLFRPHILRSIGILTEIPYYIMLYMLIYLSGALLAYLQKKNPRLFRGIIVSLAFLFIIFFFGVYISIYISNIVSYDSFLMWGFTYSAFLLLVLLSLSKINLLPHGLERLSIYILPIYMLQYPLIIPIAYSITDRIALLNRAPVVSAFFITLMSLVIVWLSMHFFGKVIRNLKTLTLLK